MVGWAIGSMNLGRGWDDIPCTEIYFQVVGIVGAWVVAHAKEVDDGCSGQCRATVDDLGYQALVCKTIGPNDSICGNIVFEYVWAIGRSARHEAAADQVEIRAVISQVGQIFHFGWKADFE